MKEWFLENTSVTKEEYERIIECGKGMPDEIDWNYINSNPDALTMLTLSNFTMKKPTLSRRYKYKVKKDAEGYNLNGIWFSLFYRFIKDKNLFSSKRYGHCHEMCFAISLNKDFFDVVTAICLDPQVDHEFLHSFLYRKNQEGKEYVLDYTLNLIMKKKIIIDLCK